jgi:hypothetical protein
MASTSRTYFESMYSQSHDPWEFETSEYEHRKYGLTVAALPRQRYANAFEPGCSIGVLTELLTPSCDWLLATDIVDDALARAEERLSALTNVRVEHRAIPEEWPKGPFDLVVLSEIAYYFDVDELREVLNLAVESTVFGAHVIGVHWRGQTDYPLSGDEAHEIIDATLELRRVAHYDEESFVLDVWERYQ